MNMQPCALNGGVTFGTSRDAPLPMPPPLTNPRNRRHTKNRYGPSSSPRLLTVSAISSPERHWEMKFTGIQSRHIHRLPHPQTGSSGRGTILFLYLPIMHLNHSYNMGEKRGKNPRNNSPSIPLYSLICSNKFRPGSELDRQAVIVFVKAQSDSCVRNVEIIYPPALRQIHKAVKLRRC